MCGSNTSHSIRSAGSQRTSITVCSVELPIHPNCLCFKTAVHDPNFNANLRNWVRTGQGFPAMDQYAANLGVDLDKSLMDAPVAQALQAWIDGSQADIDVRMQ